MLAESVFDNTFSLSSTGTTADLVAAAESDSSHGSNNANSDALRLYLDKGMRKRDGVACVVALVVTVLGAVFKVVVVVVVVLDSSVASHTSFRLMDLPSDAGSLTGFVASGVTGTGATGVCGFCGCVRGLARMI